MGMSMSCSYNYLIIHYNHTTHQKKLHYVYISFETAVTKMEQAWRKLSWFAVWHISWSSWLHWIKMRVFLSMSSTCAGHRSQKCLIWLLHELSICSWQFVIVIAYNMNHGIVLLVWVQYIYVCLCCNRNPSFSFTKLYLNMSSAICWHLSVLRHIRLSIGGRGGVCLQL